MYVCMYGMYVCVYLFIFYILLYIIPLLIGLLCPGVAVPVRVPSMGQIDLFEIIFKMFLIKTLSFKTVST